MLSSKIFCFCLILLGWQPKTPQAQDPTTTEAPSSQQQKNGTTDEICKTNKNCCFLYTWPGNEALDDPSTAPVECDQLTSIKGDRKHNVACFDPLIYANTTEGIRPDPDAVQQYCIENDLPCFCSTSHSCLKMSYIQTNTERILNETRFCGTLTNVVTELVTTSGCYTEKLPGTATYREVCACEPTPDGYCNGANFNFTSFGLSLVLLLTILSYSRSLAQGH